MENPAPSLTLSQFLNYAVVASLSAILSFLASLFTFRLQHKKLPAEINKTDAEATLALAQAKHFEFADNLSAGEFLSKIFQQLFDANRRSDQLITELDAAKKQISRIPAMEQEIKFLSKEVARARAQGFLAQNRGQANPAA